MVKSYVCPRCLGDLDTFYIEEGDTIATSDRIVCPVCGYTLEGIIDECFETEADDTEPDSPGDDKKYLSHIEVATTHTVRSIHPGLYPFS